MEKYKILIGLEMHCEISTTNTKVFSAAENTYSNIPNPNIRPVDMGFPGTLPVVNQEAVSKALMASIILGCKQPEYMYFERKNYFYPDLPKGYQITQETKPAPVGIFGKLIFDCNGEEKCVRIDNIHLEEDAASIDHMGAYSKIDYNRSGVPLLELVTYPDIHSAEEAVSFLETMRNIYRYAGISEADSKKGQLRCDVNISIMDAHLEEVEENWGTKVEIKNVNSFGGVRDAIRYEIERQIELKENGTYDQMPKQTRRWDEESMTTIYMRSKENAIDYRYFIDPNIPKFKISKQLLDKIKKSIPILPRERKQKYIEEYGLSSYDATVLVREKEVSDYYEDVIANQISPKVASNWITTIILGYLNKNSIDITQIYVDAKMLSDLIHLVEKGHISSKQGKEVLYNALDSKINPVIIVEKENLRQMEGVDEIEKFVLEVLNENESAKEQYLQGKVNILDFLVGQVMKKTKGKANPSITMELFRKELAKYEEE